MLATGEAPRHAVRGKKPRVKTRNGANFWHVARRTATIVVHTSPLRAIELTGWYNALLDGFGISTAPLNRSAPPSSFLATHVR